MGVFELYKLIAIQWRSPEKNIEFSYTKLNQGNMSCILAFMDLNWQLLHKKDFETHEKTARLTTNYTFIERNNSYQLKTFFI